MITHFAARDGHGAIGEAILAQLAEEGGNEARGGLHGDVALHRDHRRDAGFGQARAQAGQSAAVRGSGLGCPVPAL